MQIFAVFDSTRRFLLKGPWVHGSVLHGYNIWKVAICRICHEVMGTSPAFVRSAGKASFKAWRKWNSLCRSLLLRCYSLSRRIPSWLSCQHWEAAFQTLLFLFLHISPHWLKVYIKLGANPFRGNSFLFHQGCLFPSWLLKSISGDSRTKLGRNPNFPCDTLWHHRWRQHLCNCSPKMGGFLQTGMRFRMSHGMCELRDRYAHKFTQSVFQSSVNGINHLAASNSCFFFYNTFHRWFPQTRGFCGTRPTRKELSVSSASRAPSRFFGQPQGMVRSEITVRSVKILPDVRSTLPRSSSSPVDCTAKPSSSITGPPGIWRWH